MNRLEDDAIAVGWPTCPCLSYCVCPGLSPRSCRTLHLTSAPAAVRCRPYTSQRHLSSRNSQDMPCQSGRVQHTVRQPSVRMFGNHDIHERLVDASIYNLRRGSRFPGVALQYISSRVRKVCGPSSALLSDFAKLDAE